MSEDYLDANMPNGEWAAVSTRLGRLWKSRFPRQLAGRGWMNWNAKDGNRITFGLWSKQRTLKPGETLSLEADYGMEALTR